MLCCAVLCAVVQILGAMSGAALVNALTPPSVFAGMGDGAPGCFDAKSVNPDITKAQVFGWEVSTAAGISGILCAVYTVAACTPSP
jgi:hypothetical protein